MQYIKIQYYKRQYDKVSKITRYIFMIKGINLNQIKS